MLSFVRAFPELGRLTSPELVSRSLGLDRQFMDQRASENAIGAAASRNS